MNDELEPELLAFVHVTPGPYPDVEDPCGHTFEQHDWGYEGEGSCNGERSKLYEWESPDDGPFSCNCSRSPDEIEIEYLRSALRAAQPLTKEGIDTVIAKTIEEFITDAKEPLSTWEIHLARVGMNFLRDALLDSLADKGE